jgi:diguanylate cyclase (GGDEF)-like protein
LNTHGKRRKIPEPEKKLSEKIEDFLNRQPKATIFLLGILISLLVATTDFLPHDRLFSFVIFYLVPILLVTWFAGRVAGIFMAVICAGMWLLSDLLRDISGQSPIVPYVNMVIKLGFFIWVASMLFDLKKALQLQKLLSRTDYLTGLFNRRYFSELAVREIQRMQRYGHPFTFLYMDIDDFKVVNDRFGHVAGDGLLRAVGSALKTTVRQTDIPVRLGGDEFAVLMPETHSEGAAAALKRIREKLSDSAIENKHPVTFSFGSVTFTRPPESLDEMIQKTDRLMYQVKESGKNNIKSEVCS